MIVVIFLQNRRTVCKAFYQYDFESLITNQKKH